MNLAFRPVMELYGTTAGTGLYGLDAIGGYVAGDTVVVIGPGPVGLMTVQLCKALGAERVILVGTRQSRLELGARLGADVVVDARPGNAVAAVREAAGKRGVALGRAGSVAARLANGSGFVSAALLSCGGSRIGSVQRDSARQRFLSAVRADPATRGTGAVDVCADAREAARGTDFGSSGDWSWLRRTLSRWARLS